MKNIINNIFKNLQNPDSGNEIFTTILKQKNIEIQIINSNDVQNGEWYMQEHDEWVILLKGAAVLEIEGEKISLINGDSIFIEKKQKHRVLLTNSQTLWLAIHIY